MNIVIANFKPQNIKYQTLILTKKNYKETLYIVLKFFEEKIEKVGIEENVYMGENVKIGKNVWIGKFSYIEKNTEIGDNTKIFPNVYIGENVRIGKNVLIFPFVYIHGNCIIGNNVIIHSGAKIGTPGFGYVKINGEYKFIPQIGNVIIEDDVEIGANTTIDRATLGTTIIKRGTKIDNLVQIAHNVEIGENTVIAAQTGIAGSTKVGKNVIIAGQVGIVDHAIIEDNVIIAAKSGVSGNLKKNKIYSGYLAREHKKVIKSYSLFYRLPEIYKTIKELKKEIEKIKGGKK